MKEDPDVVCLYIPLMKELGMSWGDIQSLSKSELNGILLALNTYNSMHSFDGHNSKSIGEMSKNDPSVSTRYATYREVRERMESKVGIKRKMPEGFKNSLGIK